MGRRAAIAVTLLAGCGFRAPAGTVVGEHDDARPIDSDEPPAIDAAIDGLPDAATIDAPPGTVCFGTFGKVCLAAQPSGTFNVGMGVTTQFDTDGAMCEPTVTGTTIPNLCVIAAAAVTFDGTLVAHGSKVLVIVASSVQVNGTGIIDVSSHVAGNVRGAGAAASCAGTNAPTGGGGGAGGSFYLGGGNGGPGGAGNGGTPNSTLNLTLVRGGCPGEKGGNTNGGAGGYGGGGLQIIATSIDINGQLRANGAGGAGGDPINTGGGGGGSGGAIVLDTNALTVNGSGRLMAQGGGGAEGASANASGHDGGETTTAGTAAAGGDGNSSGGGGEDGAITMPAASGHAGGAGAGGGGGGGGPGFVHTTDPSPTNSGMAFPNFN